MRLTEEVLVCFVTRDLSRRQTLEYSEEASPGVRMRVEDDRSGVRWSRSEERSVMRGTISYCLAATPTQVFRAPQ